MPIPSGSAPRRRKLLAESLFEELQEAIVGGVLEPGEMVSELTIATRAGVSRTPVREALDRLGALWLVESLPRRGTRVAPLDSDRHRQTLETLLPLVVESVRLAVEIADETQMRGLVARSSEDIPDPMTADGLFEYAIDLLGAGRVARAWRDLVPHVRRHWTLVPEEREPGIVGDDRVALMSSIEAREADRAASIVRAWFDQRLEIR